MKHQNLIRQKRTLHKEPTVEEYSAAYEIDFSDDPEPEPKPQAEPAPQPAASSDSPSAPAAKIQAEPQPASTPQPNPQPAPTGKTVPSAPTTDQRVKTRAGRKGLIAVVAAACLLLVLFFFFRRNSSNTTGSLAPSVESQQAEAEVNGAEESITAETEEPGEAQSDMAEEQATKDEIAEGNDDQDKEIPDDSEKDEDTRNEGTGEDGTTASGAVPQIREVTIPEPDYEDLTVDGIYVGSRFVIEESEPEVYTGSISGDETDIYYFTGEIDGWYSFKLESSKQNALDIIVRDSKETKLIDSHTGRTIELIAGEKYTIEVSQYNEPADYTLTIGKQTLPLDITEITTIEDQFSFEDQENYYTYTAPRDGYYRFDLTQMNANMRINTVIQDRYGTKLKDSTSNKMIQLEEGETYTIRVQQYDGLGSYTMLVYTQKPTQDITGYGAVNDSIQYNDQSNFYTFTAPFDGEYRFETTDIKADTRFSIVVRDKFDTKLMDVYYGNSVNMEAGETYTIEVQQSMGLGSYKLLIGYQKETVDISDADIVYDSITFVNQVNEYIYIPSETREYTFKLGEYLSSCRLDIVVMDKFDNKLVNNYGSGTATLEANQTYRIQVCQNYKNSSYSLSIQ